MRLSRWSLSFLTALAVAGTLLAADSDATVFATPDVDEPLPLSPEEQDRAAFRERDVNQDGWLSGSEIIGISHYDVDGNAEVAEDEFVAGRAGERILLREGTVLPEDIDLFDGLDSTGSGYISGVDIERGGVASFDSDGNGRVTRQEFYSGRQRLRRELEARARAAQEAESRRRAAAGEPEPAPPLDEVLKPKPGFMRGRVLTPDGKPVDQFTIEFIGYNIDASDPSIVARRNEEPNLIGRVQGRDGYYEVRLPNSSFGLAASITIPTDAGPKQYPLRSEIEAKTIDYIEVERRNDGVVKNMIWDPAAGEIKSGAIPDRVNQPRRNEAGPPQ